MFNSFSLKSVVSLMCLCLLTACVYLPTSGSVNESQVEVGTKPQLLGLSAPGPIEDGTPEQIVTGFIRACAAGYSDEFNVARSFLSAKASLDWHPDQQVQIFDTNSQLEVNKKDDGSVVVSAKSLARVDKNGTYIVAEPQTLLQENFSLVRASDNQWRIAQLADGVILSQAAFSGVFTAAPIYFLTLDNQALVADLRWYPRWRLSTYLVNAILAGPPDYLQGAVSTAFPPGSTLRGGAVEVFEGVAQVSLNLTEPLVDQRQIALAYWQMESTLVASPGVASVAISQGETPLDIQHRITLNTAAQFLVMVSQGNIVKYTGEKTEVMIAASSLKNVEPANPVVSIDGRTLAFTDLDLQNTYIWVGGKAQSVFRSKKVLPPAVDRFGWVWTGESLESSHLRVVGVSGQVDLAVPWEHSKAELEKIAVSSDGSRLVVLRNRDGVRFVTVCTITRDAEGVPTKIVFPMEVDAGGDVPIDVGWLKGYSLVLLTSRDAETNVKIVPLFGPVGSLPGIKEAKSLAAGQEENEIYLLNYSGELYKRSGRTWQQELTGVSDPAFAR